MSPSDQPLEIRITLSREEAIDVLERLAREDDFRDQFEKNPYEFLAENGIEVSPREAVPPALSAPPPESVEQAIEQLRASRDDELVPWNAQVQWPFFPFIGLLAKPMKEGGGSEAA